MALSETRSEPAELYIQKDSNENDKREIKKKRMKWKYADTHTQKKEEFERIGGWGRLITNNQYFLTCMSSRVGIYDQELITFRSFEFFFFLFYY